MRPVRCDHSLVKVPEVRIMMCGLCVSRTSDIRCHDGILDAPRFLPSMRSNSTELIWNSMIFNYWMSKQIKYLYCHCNSRNASVKSLGYVNKETELRLQFWWGKNTRIIIGVLSTCKINAILTSYGNEIHEPYSLNAFENSFCLMYSYYKQNKSIL